MTDCISLKQNLGFLWEIPSRRGVLLKCHFFRLLWRHPCMLAWICVVYKLKAVVVLSLRKKKREDRVLR